MLHCFAMSMGVKEHGRFTTQVKHYIGIKPLELLKNKQQIMPNNVETTQAQVFMIYWYM